MTGITGKKTFDVRLLVRDVETIVSPLLSKNGNTLVIECPDDVSVLHADQTKLRQTLFNLLSSAAKFTSGGRIELRVSPTPQPLPRARGRERRAGGGAYSRVRRKTATSSKTAPTSASGPSCSSKRSQARPAAVSGSISVTRLATVATVVRMPIVKSR